MAKTMGVGSRRILGIFLWALGALCLGLFIFTWRVVERAQAAADGATIKADFLWFDLRFSEETAVFGLVIAAGALGAFIHAGTSYAKRTGHDTLTEGWVPWYLFRPIIGSALAVVLYAVLRGGLLTTGASSTDLNEFGVAAVSAMAGMFSKQAVDKLAQVFDTVFATAPGQGATAPVVLATVPDVLTPGAGAVVRIIGVNLTEDCEVWLGETQLDVTFVKPSELRVSLTGEMVTSGGVNLEVRSGDAKVPVSIEVSS